MEESTSLPSPARGSAPPEPASGRKFVRLTSTIAAGLIAAVVMFWISRQNYLLFHGIVELFSIAVAWGVFMLVWNSRRFMENQALVGLGVAFFFIGLFALLHTLAYKGMPVLGDPRDPNPATQLWIAGRYMQAIAFLGFALFLGRKPPPPVVFAILTFIACLLLGAIFVWKVFPTCFVEGQGLTGFKVASEYIVCAMMAVSLALLSRRRRKLDVNVHRSLMLAVGFSTAAGLSFTLYTDVYGLSNVIGHLFCVASFGMVYLGLIRIGLTKPYALLFRELAQKERLLQARLHLSESSHIKSVPEFLQEILDESEQLTGSKIGFLHFVEEDQETLALQMWSSNTLSRMCTAEGAGKHYPVSEAGVWGDCLRQRRPVIHNDYAALPHRRGTPPGHAPVVRELVVPIFQNERIVAILGVGNKEADYTREDVDLTANLGGMAWDLVVRKRAEEDLRRSREHYRLVADFTYDWEYWIDPAGKCLYVSPSCERVSGYPPSFFIENPGALLDIVHPEDRHILAKHLDDVAAASSESCELEFRIIRKNGEIRWINHTCWSVFTNEGVFAGRRGSQRDVTESKSAKDALENESSYRRTLFEKSPDGIVIIDPQTARFLDFNTTAHRQLGYSREEFAALSVFDVEARETAEETRARIAAVLSGGSADFETLQRTRDGEIRNVHVTAQIIDIQGSMVYHCIWRDITERMQAKEDLRSSEERNSRLIESLTDAILVLVEGIITYANPAALRLFRADGAEELLGKRYLDRVHPDDRAGSVERIRRNLEENWLDPPREHRILSLDGQAQEVESIGVTLRHRGESQLVIVFRDITERKRVGQEKEKLEIQLRQAQKMEAIGTLAGGIAHDFNNILSVIIGNAEMMNLSDESEPLRHNVAPILTASNRARKLVSQILTFSRQGEQQKLLINLKAVIKETIEFLRASLPATIQLNQYLHPEAGTILADPTQMQQVLMNLCTNAAHAMKNGGGVLKIELDNCELTEADSLLTAELDPGDYVKLTVSDTGHGMEAWVRERIFDPYFTTKEPGQGTGLGLSVVHGIVRSHGGSIKAYSEPGQGSTFHVYLPRTDGLEKTESPVVQPLPRGTERILLVDDETALADLGKRMLGFLGYRVEVRTSPVDALELFRAEPERFDAVLTDMTMPQMTGLHLMREILAIRPGIPAILCTGFSDQTNEEKVLSYGIRALLFKPLVIADLANELRRVIDEKQPEAALHIPPET